MSHCKTFLVKPKAIKRRTCLRSALLNKNCLSMRFLSETIIKFDCGGILSIIQSLMNETQVEERPKSWGDFIESVKDNMENVEAFTVTKFSHESYVQELQSRVFQLRRNSTEPQTDAFVLRQKILNFVDSSFEFYQPSDTTGSIQSSDAIGTPFSISDNAKSICISSDSIATSTDSSNHVLKLAKSIVISDEIEWKTSPFKVLGIHNTDTLIDVDGLNMLDGTRAAIKLGFNEFVTMVQTCSKRFEIQGVNSDGGLNLVGSDNEQRTIDLPIGRLGSEILMYIKENRPVNCTIKMTQEKDFISSISVEFGII